MNAFEVLQPGLQTTVQDLGRPGYLATGMPPSGATDRFSLAVANLLAGNDPGDRYLVGRSPGAAGLECLLMGPRLRVLRPLMIAITGARGSPKVNGIEVPMWTTIKVMEGDEVAVGAAAQGARLFLAVAGGIDVPQFAGSRATNVRAFVGGVDGRALKKGDLLRAGAASDGDVFPRRKLRREFVPEFRPPHKVRVVLGPQDDLFEKESVRTFLSYGWQLSPISDRMGFRYIGPKLEFRPRPDYLIEQAGSDPSNIVDDTIPVGGIQVPSGLEPIVLHVDGPSLGGYAKIATVISADLGRVGQTRPGEVTHFVAVTPEAGVEALRELDALISEISLEPVWSA
jgi:biotin-dependent carboxylase-like uncharacterized protein